MSEDEQRKAISLSQYAYDTMLEDFLFLPKRYCTRSGYINYVFLSYYEKSSASIELHAKQYTESLKERLQVTLEKPKLQAGARATIDALSSQHKNGLRQMIEDYPREETFNIRLNNELFELLSNGTLEDLPSTYARDPQYIKAVIEDFTRLPRIEREKVYFREIYDKLSDMINREQNQKSVLVISYSNGMKGSADDKRSRDTKHYFKPYRIINDEERQHIYCVGYASKTSAVRGFSPISFKLSRIQKCKELSRKEHSGKITENMKELLEERLRERGFWFLEDPSVDVSVRLTAYGEIMYNNFAHLRPRTLKEDPDPNGTIHHFRCSMKQAQTYFYKFGDNAEVLEPLKLRNWFRKSYQKALSLYED